MDPNLRSRPHTVLKLMWGTCLLLSSVYCLLAFLPYTYYAFVKASPYDWLHWFVRWHPALYVAAALAAAVAYWPRWRSWWYVTMMGVQAAIGLRLAVRPLLSAIPNDWSAHVWGLAMLFPMVAAGIMEASDLARSEDPKADGQLFAYGPGVLVAASVALLCAAAVQLHSYFETDYVELTAKTWQLAGWSMVTHALLAVLALSILNLVWLAAQKSSQPRTLRTAVLGLLAVGGLWVVLARFLENAFSFQGWPAHLYAAMMAASLTGFGMALAAPLFSTRRPRVSEASRYLVLLGMAALALAAFGLPSIIRGRDWNGVLQHGSILLVWILLAICAYRLRPQRRRYSTAAVLAIILVAGFAYKSLEATAIFWAKPLASTDDEFQHALDEYAGQDVSFNIAHQILERPRGEPCGELCRILRQYTNIRDASAAIDLKLVDELVPNTGPRPNIFIFVIDSLRPDYLGAYNPAVDFTPNLDALARESLVLRKAFTEYSGTVMSEPAIWAGARLLHAQYMQPFARLNSLEKLAHNDGYQMFVSYDMVLRQLLSPSPDLVKLDTANHTWNRFELCSTLNELESALDARSDRSRPVFFFAQPMNVHLFAINDLPRATSQNWKPRPGLNNRMAYGVHLMDGCLGSFFAYLKARGMYQNSIVIVTADHGESLGEFGRHGHSLHIYPEVVRVPLIVRLPPEMRAGLVSDAARISTLTDIAPSLYYLLGHRPICENRLFGRPLFAQTTEELHRYEHSELFLASDVRAVYGILADRGRFLYVTYDSPARSFLFDLASDPNAEHSVLTDALKKHYDRRIIEELQGQAAFYGYKPSSGTLLASSP